MSTIESPLQQVTGAVLAGGLSTRMGTSKHDLKLPDGRTMLETMLSLLGEVCQEILVVAPNIVIADLPHIHDPKPGCGPLAGVTKLLESQINHHYLIVPCDMPHLTSKLLSELCRPLPHDARVFRLDLEPHPSPLPLVISSNAKLQMQRAQQQGIRSLHRALAHIDLEVQVLPDEQRTCLHNVNTPQDL